MAVLFRPILDWIHSLNLWQTTAIRSTETMILWVSYNPWMAIQWSFNKAPLPGFTYFLNMSASLFKLVVVSFVFVLSPRTNSIRKISADIWRIPQYYLPVSMSNEMNTSLFPEIISWAMDLPLGMVGYSHSASGCDGDSIFDHWREFLEMVSDTWFSTAVTPVLTTS